MKARIYHPRPTLRVSRSRKQVALGLCLAAATLWPTTVPAIPVEIGLTPSIGFHGRDRFERGMEKFRSSLNPNLVSARDVERNRLRIDQGFFVRAGGLLSRDEGHMLGMRVGSYRTSAIQVTELRSDGFFLDMTIKQRLPYVMFTYDYLAPLRLRWSWEAGFGYGFLTGARTRTSGNSYKNGTVESYDGSHGARFGNIWRLNAGLYRPLSNHVFLRFGLQATFVFYGNFSGLLNNFDSSYYYTRDGSLTIVSAREVASSTATSDEVLSNGGRFFLVKEKATVQRSHLEFYFSLGFRI